MKKVYLSLSLMLLFFQGCDYRKDYTLFDGKELKEQGLNNKIASPFQVVNNSGMSFEYKIRPHDRISILTYKHPELSTTTLGTNQDRGILVSNDGFIRLPLVKKVQIAGLTQTQAEEKIEKSLKKYLKYPEVNIDILNKKAYVIGEVKNSGDIELPNEQMTLLQVLAKAGDMKDGADRSAVMVFRGSGATVRTEVIDLTSRENLMMANLMIRPNDIVYVMPTGLNALNKQINEVEPIFRMIGSILSPFVNIKYLSGN